jgi:serine/threonine protein kinase
VTDLIGARLGPYEIISPLGTGSMGEVYRARDSRLGREVAVKVLPRELSGDANALARFEREARAVAAINHPNILALHDVGTEAGIAHAVMELLEGDTLRKRLESGPIPPRRALDWASQIASGLAAAHERGIVHRDLKPANIFVTRDGRVKILDFGVAQHDPADEDRKANLVTHSQTAPGVFIGTPAYASPEQVLGEGAIPSSDMFAFGVVVYEMLTGTNPFLRKTVADTMTSVLREDPPALGKAVRGLPTAAIRVIERCLEKQPAQRPTSARDVAFYLDASVESDAAAAPPVTAEQDQQRKRLQRMTLVGTAGVLLTFVGLTWGYVYARTDRVVTDAVERELANAETLVTGLNNDRIERLRLTARLVASFPRLNALFETKDAATIRDFLLFYQQQNPGTPLLVALGPTGDVLGRTDTVESRTASGEDASIRSVTSSLGTAAVVSIGGKPHHAAGAAAEGGGTVFGYVVAAAPLDQVLAQSIGEWTGDETVLLSKDTVLASTFPGGQSPWSSLDDWRNQGGRKDRAKGIAVGARRFLAREIPLEQDPPISAIVARSRDDAAEPFRQIQNGLIVIGALAAVVAALMALWVARTTGKVGL